jgi:catechol 2,3-dioxygenase-like lactoylglutathione lyase family enzyme
MAVKTSFARTQIAYRASQNPMLNGVGTGVINNAKAKAPTAPSSSIVPGMPGALGGVFNHPQAGGVAKATTPVKPGVSPFGASAPAGAAAGASPAAPAGPPVDPLGKVKDSGYLAEVAQGLLNGRTGLAKLQLRDTRAGEDKDTALSRLARNYAGQRQNLNEGANKSGLFYSGILGKRLGDAEVSNRDQQDEIGHNYTRLLEDDQIDRGALKTQYGDPDAPKDQYGNADYGITGQTALANATGRFQLANPTPATVMGRPGENGLPGLPKSWGGHLNPGYTVEWDPVTGKAKRIVKVG